jgi:hypothetical protein
VDITSLEALTALPEGAEVAVRSGMQSVTWTRTGSGLVRDGVLMDPYLFVGYIETGRMVRVDNTRAAPGDWLRRHRYTYICVRYNENGQMVLLPFQRGQMLSEIAAEPESLTRAMYERIDPWPETLVVQPELVRQVWSYYQDLLLRTNAELTRAREALAKKPDKSTS